MIAWKLLLSATAICAVAAGECDTVISPYDNILLNKVTPIFYDVHLNMENHSIILGESNILLNVRRAIRSIRLHSCELEIDIDSIVLRAVNMNTTAWYITYKPDRDIYCQKAQIVELTFKNEIRSGLYNLNMKFKLLVVANKSLILYDRSFWLSTIRSELNSARRVFPCWDQPGAKARFSFSVKHSARYTVLSNMPISYQTKEENNIQSTYFTKTPMIGPHEVAIVLTQNMSGQTSRTSSGVTIWHRPQINEDLAYMFSAIEDCKEIFDMYFGDYKLMLKTDYVLIPNISTEIMGYPGLIICREQDFTYNENLDYPGRQSIIRNLLGQEMARRWCSRIASPSGWFDFFLYEMFASFLNYILVEELQDKSIQDLYAVQMVQSALYQDFAFEMKPVLHRINNVDKIEKNLYLRMYRNKGAALIRMLHYLFTAEDFQTAIRIYFITDDSSSKLDNMWDLLKRISEQRNKEWSYKVQDIIDTWILLPSYPEVYVKRDYSRDTANVSANCIFFCTVPITYITESNFISGYTWNATWLRNQENIIISEIAKNDFIIVNLEQAGYYRVNYDLHSWQKIVSYLITQNHTLIHVINRAQLIDDAFFFTMQGKLKPFIFLNLIEYLSKETNYIAWYPVFNILSRMSTYLGLPEAKNFKMEVLSSLENLLRAIGYEERSSEDDMTKSLRLLAVKWACKLDSKECKKAALFKLIQHLDHLYIPIRPWWREWIYCTGMETADIRTWRRWMRKCIIQQDRTCLTYLACAGNKDIFNEYLAMLLGTIRTDEFMEEAGTLTLFHTLFRKHANNDSMFEIFVKNRDRINDKIYNGHDIDPIKLLREVIGTMYSKDCLMMMTTYAGGLKFKDEAQKRLFHNMIEFRFRELARAAKPFQIFSTI